MSSPIKLGIEPRFGHQSGYFHDILIANSATVVVGGLVRCKQGGVEPIDATTERIFGLVVGIGKNGIPLDNLTPTADYGGTYTATLKKYVAYSDNQTVDKVKAKVFVSPLGVYSFKCDTAIGTTQTSDQPGVQFSLNATTSDKVIETSATTNPMQIFGLGADPADTDKVLGLFAETQAPCRADQGADA